MQKTRETRVLFLGREESPGGGHGSPLLPGESHGQSGLVGYSPRGHGELDTTEAAEQAHTILMLTLHLDADFEFRLLLFIAQSCPTLCSTTVCSLQAPLSMDSPGKKTGEGCHFLLPGIFLTQRLNLSSLLGRWILYP